MYATLGLDWAAKLTWTAEIYYMREAECSSYQGGDTNTNAQNDAANHKHGHIDSSGLDASSNDKHDAGDEQQRLQHTNCQPSA